MRGWESLKDTSEGGTSFHQLPRLLLLVRAGRIDLREGERAADVWGLFHLGKRMFWLRNLNTSAGSEDRDKGRAVNSLEEEECVGTDGDKGEKERGKERGEDLAFPSRNK